MSRLLLLVVIFGAACGGSGANTPASPPPPTAATTATPLPQPAGEPPFDRPSAGEVPAAAATSAAEEPPSPASAPPKLEFPPHASVDAAINVVPHGLPRMNMSSDVLQGPLLDLKRYDTCKVPRSTKVAMSVAVYDGAAVGVDVTTKPKSPKLEACIDTVVRGMSWDKVPSLNQVNVSF